MEPSHVSLRTHISGGHLAPHSWLDSLGFAALNKALLQYLWIINGFMGNTLLEVTFTGHHSP